jgi:hypothetical protein
VGKGEVINVGAGRNVSVARIAELIGGPVEHIAPRLEPRDALADNTRAKELLGWSPTVSIEDGIAGTSGYASLLSLPSPDPASIVKWLGKLVTTLVGPEVAANIKYVLALSQVLQELPKVITAIENLGPAIAACAVTDAESVIQQLYCIASVPVDNALGTHLSTINATQLALQAINANHFSTTLDTSNTANFVTSVNAVGNTFANQLSNYANTPNYITSTGATFVANTANVVLSSIPSNTYISNYVGLIVQDSVNAIPTNTTILSINTSSNTIVMSNTALISNTSANIYFYQRTSV